MRTLAKKALIGPLLSLAVLLCHTPAAFCEEALVPLEISVTNTADESREIHVHVDLPVDLSRNDVVSSDGLDIKYDAERKGYFAEGDVVLQSHETTFYTVRVRNVWTIPDSRIGELRDAIAELPPSERKPYEERLAVVVERQGKSSGTVLNNSDVKSLIATYGENRKEFDNLSGILRPARKKAPSAPSFKLLLVLVLGAAAAGVYIAMRMRWRFSGGPEQRRFKRVIRPSNVTCQIVYVNEDMPPAASMSISPRDISEGGICLDLPDAYKSESVLDIKIKLPSVPQPLHFLGAVMWQKKIKGDIDKGYGYLTGIDLYEATQEDMLKLKDYVDARLT